MPDWEILQLFFNDDPTRKKIENGVHNHKLNCAKVITNADYRSKHRQTTLRMRESVTSRYFETVVTADSTDPGKCSIKTSNRSVFFPKIHFMDSQINKVYSPTIFCVVLSDLMGFRDASIFSFRSDASSHTLGSLRNEDGDGNEDFSLKYEFAGYSYHYETISCRFRLKMCSNCQGIKLVWVSLERRERTENWSSCANVLHRTLNLVISRRHLGDDGKEMYQNVKRTCRACRAIVFAH